VTIHVYPLNDWIDHDVETEASECRCVCEPRIVYLAEDGMPLSEAIVIHNAVDGRDKKESENRG